LAKKAEIKMKINMPHLSHLKGWVLVLMQKTKIY